MIVKEGKLKECKRPRRHRRIYYSEKKRKVRGEKKNEEVTEKAHPFNMLKMHVVSWFFFFFVSCDGTETSNL